MRPEWQRRLLAISIASVYAGLSRVFESGYEKVGLDPVWITRISAIATLLLCFKLTDMIPDHAWPRLAPYPRLRRAALVALTALWLMALLGLFLGEAH